MGGDSVRTSMPGSEGENQRIRRQLNYAIVRICWIKPSFSPLIGPACMRPWSNHAPVAWPPERAVPGRQLAQDGDALGQGGVGACGIV